MFCNTQLEGMNMAFPDVCDTPLAAGAPVPIPYPNISMTETAVPAAYTILIDGAPAHNMESEAVISQGDDAGVELGMASGMVMGPTRHMLGSATCVMVGLPATRLTDMTGQNGESPNAVGATLVPCQVCVLCLAG